MGCSRPLQMAGRCSRAPQNLLLSQRGRFLKRFARSMEFHGKDLGVRCKIWIGSEDRPTPPHGHRADKKIYREDRDTLGPALIAKERGILVVRPVYELIVKGAQVHPELLVLLGSFHSRKQFLPDQPDDRRSAFTDQFGQLRNDQLFCRA